jgi:hypothetical protein
MMNKSAGSDHLLPLGGRFAIVRCFRHDPSLSCQSASETKQKRSLAVETYCSVLGFSNPIVSKDVANVNNVVFPIDKENFLYSFLLFELLSQELSYCSVVQLTHPSRIDNNIAGLLRRTFKIAFDSRQFIGLWRLNLVQSTVNHNICRLCFMIITNGHKFNSKPMSGKSMSGLQLMLPWRNTSWNNNFSGLMRHSIHSNKEQGNKTKGFENKTNTSKVEAFLYLLLSLAGTPRIGNP